jgi:hypothetical protein
MQRCPRLPSARPRKDSIRNILWSRTKKHGHSNRHKRRLEIAEKPTKSQLSAILIVTFFRVAQHR